MPQAIINPAEVRRFAAFLREMTEALRAKKSSTTGSFENLKAVWRDEKYAQFQRIFSETNAHLDHFFKQAENYAHYLRKKAEKAERYQEHRY